MILVLMSLSPNSLRTKPNININLMTGRQRENLKIVFYLFFFVLVSNFFLENFEIFILFIDSISTKIVLCLVWFGYGSIRILFSRLRSFSYEKENVFSINLMSIFRFVKFTRAFVIDVLFFLCFLFSIADRNTQT